MYVCVPGVCLVPMEPENSLNPTGIGVSDINELTYRH